MPARLGLQKDHLCTSLVKLPLLLFTPAICSIPLFEVSDTSNSYARFSILQILYFFDFLPVFSSPNQAK